EPYTRGHLIPILDDGNFGVVTFLDPDTRALIQIHVESPDECATTFQHWQQYLAQVMIRIAEVAEDDERVRRIAALIQFSHTKQLFEYLDRAQQLDGDAWWEARRLFPLSITV